MPPTDEKLIDLPADGSPARTDISYEVKNPSGVPTDQKVTWASILALVLDTDVTFSDVTTGNVSTSKHGFFPKLPSGVVSNLLGRTKYAPATTTTVTTTSTTLAVIDGTNLTVTFTAPPSGVVIAVLTAFTDISSTAQQYFWALLDGSNALVSGTGGCVSRDNLGVATIIRFLVTGLTPGTSYTWKWAHGVTGVATGRTLYGPGVTSTTVSTSNMFMPALMEVWAA